MKTLTASLLAIATIAILVTGCKPTEETGHEHPSAEHPAAAKPSAEHPAAKSIGEHPATNKPAKPLDHPAH